MPMRKDYNEIIALANDVGRKQDFMLCYGQICGSAAASFDAHGHDEKASYYLSHDPVLRVAYDHFKGTLEAAWSSTTVDADLTSCSACQTLFESARAYAGSRPLCPGCLEQDHGADMHMDPDYHCWSATSSDDYSSDQSETSSEREDSTYDCAYDASSFHEESSSFVDVLG